MIHENKIHHTNIVLGGEECKNIVLDFLLEKLEFSWRGNPDFILFEGDSFGIDEARGLEKWVLGKPIAGEIKVSLVLVRSLTFEAQNALLKVLEEPPLGTYFFICIESLGSVLGTFISRARVLDLETSSTKKESRNLKDAKKFLDSKIGERFEIIKSLSKITDKSEIKDLIKNLEGASYEYYKKDPEKMGAVLTAKILLSSRGSSPKMILEWLSSVL